MVMGLREANQNFGKLVRAVRRGKTVILTDRGQPLAEVRPAQAATDLEPEEQAALNAMVADGVIRRAEWPRPMDWKGWKPLHVPGVSLSQAVIEDREETD